MSRKYFASLLLAAAALSSKAQNTYLQLGQEDYQLLDRLETRQGFLDQRLFLVEKPVARRDLVMFLDSVKKQDFNNGSEPGAIGLSKIDHYNIDHAISVSGEWAPNGDGAINSKKPWFKGAFYKKQPDLLWVKTPDFFLSVNPVLSFSGFAESSNTSDVKGGYNSARGVELRARIIDRIGLYTYFADNQEQVPSFVKKWADEHEALPGVDYYQEPNTKTYDYLAARGYIDIAAVKNYFNVTFGYDRHFIGDGYRSLFMSDFSAPATFLALNLKIWKLNYQNLYMELTQQYQRGGDRILPHKYATMHHLSVNALPWLNVGLFESVIFAREDHFEFSYLNPIILYRSIERANGSPDNVNLGIDFKTLVAHHFQFYGQFFLDEFKSSELFSGDGWYGNKFGLQLGGKYFDAFNIKNLDFQAEMNLVRPFTYSHYDTTSNYTHYNQPLAHPLGAGFGEFIGIVRYQPIRNLYLSAKAMYYKQGIDTNGTNYGSNPFMNYSYNTPVDASNPYYGYKLTNGVGTNTYSLNLNASYELRENVFIDMGFTRRNRVYVDKLYSDETSTYFYGGIRLNIVRRDYDFY